VPTLADADLTLELGKKQSNKRLKELRERFGALRLQLGGHLDDEAGPGLLVLLEGWDAGGKGGAVRRMIRDLEPTHYTVKAWSAPTERERRHHFLWRFGPHLPGLGGMTIFDRSWYGRVLVERVEGFATEAEWQRAYGEIVDFERSLCVEGMILVKLWLHISEAEERRRFERREDRPLKAWKLTDEDWRNLEKRPQYEPAVEDMLARTEHPQAPWHVIAGENKPYARVAVMETVIAEIERGLREAGIEPTELGRS
jgi:polyphosphate kinase 2 (PPK2 family)